MRMRMRMRMNGWRLVGTEDWGLGTRDDDRRAIFALDYLVSPTEQN